MISLGGTLGTAQLPVDVGEMDGNIDETALEDARRGVGSAVAVLGEAPHCGGRGCKLLVTKVGTALGTMLGTTLGALGK